MKKSTKATLGQETPGNRCDNLVKTVSPGVFLKPRLTRRVGSGVEQQATQNWMSLTCHSTRGQGREENRAWITQISQVTD